MDNLRNLASDVQKVAEAACVEPQSSESPPVRPAFHVYESPLIRRYRTKYDKRRPSAVEKANLKDNPWARMLASPVRTCTPSSSRLPMDLLTEFNLVKAPNDGIYLMPVKLADLDEFEPQTGATRLRKSQPQAQISQPSSKEQTILTNHSPQEDSVIPGPPEADDEASLRSDQPRSTLSHEKQLGESPRLRHLMSTLRLLTNINFMRFATYMLGQRSQKAAKGDASSSYKAASLFSSRARERLNAALHYERNHVEFGLATGTMHEAPRRQDMFDVGQLDWQPDISQRMTRIMQKRILAALASVAERMNGREANRWNRSLKPMPIPRKTGHFEFGQYGIISLPKSDLDQVHVDFENAGIRSEPKRDQGQESNETLSPAPSIDEVANPYPSDEAVIPRWLAGSIFVHVGKSDIERLLPAASTHVNARAFPSHLQNSLIPPMIPIEDKFRLPVFSLHRLLNPDGDAEPDRLPDSTKQDLESLAQILNTCRAMHLRGEDSSAKVVYSPLTTSPPVDDLYEDYLILIKAKAGQNPGLISEVWRLWRYLAGRNLGALPGSDKDDH